MGVAGEKAEGENQCEAEHEMGNLRLEGLSNRSPCMGEVAIWRDLL